MPRDLAFAFLCPARWDQMVGSETERHCTVCDRTVVNLSALTPEAAWSVVTSGGTTPCVRALTGPGGRLVRAAAVAALAACGGEPSAPESPAPAPAVEAASEGEKARGRDDHTIEWIGRLPIIDVRPEFVDVQVVEPARPLDCEIVLHDGRCARVVRPPGATF